MKAQVWNRVRERLSGLVDVRVGMQVVGSVEGDKAMKGWVFIGFIHHHAGESRSRIVATGRDTSEEEGEKVPNAQKEAPRPYGADRVCTWQTHRMVGEQGSRSKNQIREQDSQWSPVRGGAAQRVGASAVYVESRQ